jgi:hypothetical protein
MRRAAADEEGALLTQLTPDRLRSETGEHDLGKAFLVTISQGLSFGAIQCCSGF